MNGLLNILKPSGTTSFDVVRFIKKTLDIKKVGHTGTLDPNASGVLPICLGKATKLSNYLMNNKKIYRAELTLGAKTDTQDKFGKVLEKKDFNVTEDEIKKVFKEFKGEIEQIPPMFSALKHKGKKLYELARQGKEIERKPRKIQIYDLNIIRIKEETVIFDVVCSKGTYIRTLCNDIGEKLGTYGYMSFLLRTETGIFNIRDSYTVEEIKKMAMEGEIVKAIKPLDYPLKDYESIYLDDKFYKKISNGVKIPVDDFTNKKLKFDKFYTVYCNDKFIGIGIIIKKENIKCLKIQRLFL
ncbi:MAG: tRNA pseudouridine(55) synthase TruB [Firmicutes bacterium]|nr:tRNA pseudouridine(55) synthase TruB [Bacillota bacterium]